ncbi:MAG TPA: hypothetical protein PLD84_01065, partial [Chitinophagales bacterium]|nr:hypothetical protein [Chitinophagales bacterium]
GANVGNRLLNTYVNGSSKSAEDIIKLVLNGILLFEFSHDGELVSMDHIETGPTGIYLSASDVSSPISVGFLLKRMGIRNYAYWDPGANPDEISLIFLASKKGESPYIGIENIGAGKMKETKVPLDEIDHIAGDDGLDFENKSVSVIRSKPGYVCFYTYSKKEKTVMIKVKKV